MTLFGALGSAYDISTKDTHRRGALVGVLVFAERLLAPTVFLAYLRLGSAGGAAFGVGLAVVVFVRGALQRGHAVREESSLYRRIVAAAIHGDVLGPSVLPDDDARAIVFDGAQRVGILLADVLPTLLANMSAAFVLSVALALTQPLELTLIVTLALGVGVAFLYFSRQWVARAQDVTWKRWSVLADEVIDALDARFEIVASGRSEEFLGRVVASATTFESAARKSARIGGLSGRMPVLAFACAVGVGVIFESRRRGLDWDHAMLRAGLLAVCSPALVGVGVGVQQLLANARRLALLGHILKSSTAVPRTVGTETISPPSVVEWRGVTFAYGDSSELALSDVTITWRRGEVLALVGANGSGKSTCLRLALALGTPKAGKIVVDGVPLDRLDVDQWRRSIGFLPQNGFLPARASIRECLGFFDSDITERAMMSALERVGLTATVRGDLTTRAGTLSVGQRQRLALARLLCRTAPLLILDEPDGNMDAEGIRTVQSLVATLSKDRMVLLVAHTPELLRVASRVVTLDGGRVVLRDRHA